MIKTVLFFIASPFGKRDYARYGMEDFQRNGFDIYVWDFTPFLYPRVNEVVKLTDPIEWDRVIRFQSAADVIAALERVANSTFIFTTVPYLPATRKIFRAMSRRHIPYCVTVVNTVPPLVGNPLESFVKRLLAVTPRKLVSFALRHVPMQLMGLEPARFVLAEGALCSFVRPEVTGTTEVIRAHSLDYNIYLTEGKNGVAADGTAVFLDNYLPFHPDTLYSGEILPVAAEKFYPALRRFFDRLERKTGLRVVIAAHPRSNYDRFPGIFGGRQVVRGRTAELVKRSSLVMLTFSTSINFAVLYEKPLLFITTDELEASIYRRYIASYASFFKRLPINVERDPEVELASYATIDADAYRAYRNNYIKIDGSEEIPSWQIVCDRIKVL